jgi:hypothetical protein
MHVERASLEATYANSSQTLHAAASFFTPDAGVVHYPARQPHLLLLLLLPLQLVLKSPPAQQPHIAMLLFGMLHSSAAQHVM